VTGRRATAKKRGVVVLGGWIATVAQAAGPKIREVQVQVPKGETGATLKGKLKGDETHLLPDALTHGG
jgi:hypothetical protein